MATFIKTSRGGEKMILNNFIYRKNKNGANGQIYWICVNKKTPGIKCPGYATTDAEKNATMTQEHNHAPSPTQVEIANLRQSFRQAASTSTDPPRALVNMQLAGISDRAKVFLNI
jgi:hypothetical protein